VRRPPLKAEEEEAWRERGGTGRMSVLYLYVSTVDNNSAFVSFVRDDFDEL
jgi:hypothetical protein